MSGSDAVGAKGHRTIFDCHDGGRQAVACNAPEKPGGGCILDNTT